VVHIGGPDSGTNSDAGSVMARVASQQWAPDNSYTQTFFLLILRKTNEKG